ncbi:hypothetical protein GN956_G14544 [Arapaima gigas]
MCTYTRHKNRLLLHDDFSHGHSKPLAFGSYEGCDLTAAAAVLFPAVTLANTGKASYSFEPCKNRPTINNQPCGLFTKSTDQKSQMYTDPMCGAPVPFVHRLSEISFLVVETVRQEKLQKHRRSRRQET